MAAAAAAPAVDQRAYEEEVDEEDEDEEDSGSRAKRMRVRANGYLCSKCGKPKRGHTCTAVPQHASSSTQIDVNIVGGIGFCPPSTLSGPLAYTPAPTDRVITVSGGRGRRRSARTSFGR